MKQVMTLVMVVLFVFAVAQDTPADTSEEVSPENKRIITITYDGGNRSSPDLRYGPYQYTHPMPEGLVATVSNLTIFAQEAELRAPEGVLISEAVGEREASFINSVRVSRGRLNATGPGLTYSEVTGLGTLNGEASIEIAPKDEDNDPVFITTDMVEFDVDTDISTSRGNVNLVNGSQTATAEELIFEEERDLGKLTSGSEQATIIKEDDNGDILTITADEIRVLTESKKLHAIGNVTVVDGAITSTGDEVFFDDEASRAEVLGNPATSIDEANDIEVSGARLEQRTDLDIVRILDDSVPSDFQADTFKLSSELTP